MAYYKVRDLADMVQFLKKEHYDFVDISIIDDDESGTSSIEYSGVISESETADTDFIDSWNLPPNYTNTKARPPMMY